MIKDDKAFRTRRRVILIQMMYSIIITNAEEQANFQYEIAVNASNVSNYKSPEDLEEDAAILIKILDKLSIIDEMISVNCKAISRLSKVVLSILRVGVYELKYCEHNHSIGNIIKDYLNITMAFDHGTELGFINGILDKIYLSN